MGQFLLWVYLVNVGTVVNNKHPTKFVTGFWKTDRIVTFGLFHFIGPVSCYTMYS